MLMNTAEYISIIENIKSEITAAQYRAAVHEAEYAASLL